MKLNQIADNEGARKNRMRIGRGIGSGKGKTGGRGVKGQKARTGVRIKGREGGQMPLHRRLPKRGFNNIFAIKYHEVNLDRIQKAVDAGHFKAGDTVTAELLAKAGVLRRPGNGVRLLGNGELKVKLAFEVAGASKPAIAAVEKAGGSVKELVIKRADREKPGKMVKKPKKDGEKSGKPARKPKKESGEKA
jgi:large subunit ribosomal protein L15